MPLVNLEPSAGPGVFSSGFGTQLSSSLVPVTLLGVQSRRLRDVLILGIYQVLRLH